MITLDLSKSSGEPSTRRSLASLSLAVAKSKKIVVLTGAGISCSCGIPDFRSSDGLYALVKQQYPDVVMKGRDLFDASLFRDSTSTAVFYTFISQLKQSVDSAEPSSTHRFIKTLDAKGRLLRSYTQNIDGLEERAGLKGATNQESKITGSSKGKVKVRAKDVRNVQLHGDIHRVRCTFCSAEFPCMPDYMQSFNAGVPPDCPECTTRSEARQARSARALKVGTLRPAIVLYDEPHPLGDDIGIIQSADIARKPDMLIIMGTSLKVHGFKKLVRDFARAVHESAASSKSRTRASAEDQPEGITKGKGKAAEKGKGKGKEKPPSPNAKSFAGKVVFVNKTAPGSEWEGIIDVHISGETDAWSDRVVEDWKRMRPADWEVQTTLDDNKEGFKVMKEVTNSAIGMKPKSSKKENQPPVVSTSPDTKHDKDVAHLQHARPPSAASLALSTPSLTPPPSPSKRRSVDCHYALDVEGSPSKKRAHIAPPADSELDVDFDGRGLLFGDATNITGSKPQEAPVDGAEGLASSSAVVDGDVFGAGGAEVAVTRSRSLRGPAKAKGKGKGIGVANTAGTVANTTARKRSRSTSTLHAGVKTKLEVVVESRQGRTLRRATSARTAAIR